MKNTMRAYATWAINQRRKLDHEQEKDKMMQTIAKSFQKAIMKCFTCKFAPTCGTTDCLECPRLKDAVIIDLQEYDRTHPTEDQRMCNC